MTKERLCFRVPGGPETVVDQLQELGTFLSHRAIQLYADGGQVPQADFVIFFTEDDEGEWQANIISGNELLLYPNEVREVSDVLSVFGIPSEALEATIALLENNWMTHPF